VNLRKDHYRSTRRDVPAYVEVVSARCPSHGTRDTHAGVPSDRPRRDKGMMASRADRPGVPVRLPAPAAALRRDNGGCMSG
jgi:hypothetical protein